MTTTFDYLGGKSWGEITREERWFCAHLFSVARGRESEFVEIANRICGQRDPHFSELPVDNDWDLQYEVCFYRDLLHSEGISIGTTEFPNNRTWDLCLFSPNHVVIIEAKVEETFGAKSMESIFGRRIMKQKNGRQPGR